MMYLGNTESDKWSIRLSGSASDVFEVRRLFGDLYLGEPTEHEPYRFTVRRFRNVYVDGSGQTPLYFLVPDRRILNIWFDDATKYRWIRHGTCWHNGRTVAQRMAASLHSGPGIYICTGPEGKIVEDYDSFGI